MIQFSNITKCYGDQILFEEITFSLSKGERLGLIGRNGSGKSTLFKLILGEEQADDGQISMPRNYTVGHLAQHLKFTEENILKEVCLGLPVDERDQEYRGEIILDGLGFSADDMHKPPSSFSGGFQIRLNLAKVLLSEPNLLLLDEPTNYLDIVSARWLGRFLQEWQNEMMIITHDRDFMNSVTTHTMLIHRSTVRKIQGGTQKLYAQVAQDEEIYEKTRLNIDKKRKDMQEFIDRFRARASKATLVQSKIKALERLGQQEELSEEDTLDFKFSEAQFFSKFLLEATNINFAYPAKDNQSNNHPLIKDFNLNILKNDRIAIIGKNGKGKSTLLKILGGELKSSTGQILLNANTRLGYFGQTNIDRLSPKLTIEEEISDANYQLSKTRIRSICGTMMFQGDRALKKVNVLSGGERSRVLLGKIIAQPSNLLLLDEPTNHLDIESVEALIQSIKEYNGAVVIVTHNELILKELATRLVVFQGEYPQVLEGGYEYFLDKIGWEEEAGLTPKKQVKQVNNDKPSQHSKNSGSESNSQKLDKTQRADLVNQRSKLLTPLKKEIESVESQISSLETQIASANAELLKASQRADTIKLALLPKQIRDLEQAIEQNFTKLEQLNDNFNQISAEFESKLG